MDAHVSKGFTNPLTVAPEGPDHPSAASSSDSQSWNACVATVPTLSTIERQAGDAARSSAQTCGTMPREMANTTTSKSLPASSVWRPTSRRGDQNDSRSTPASGSVERN